jgi:Transposase DDE domain group 1
MTSRGKRYPAGADEPDLKLITGSVSAANEDRPTQQSPFKHSYGYHPVLAFCDNSNEALAGMLRPGTAGANTAADHIGLLDQALAQLPDQYRHGYPILVRADGAGASKAFLAHIKIAAR